MVKDSKFSLLFQRRKRKKRKKDNSKKKQEKVQGGCQVTSHCLPALVGVPSEVCVLIIIITIKPQRGAKISSIWDERGVLEVAMMVVVPTSDEVPQSLGCGDVLGSLPIDIGDIPVRPAVQQHLHHISVSSHHRPVQGRQPVRILEVDVDTLGELAHLALAIKNLGCLVDVTILAGHEELVSQSLVNPLQRRRRRLTAEGGCNKRVKFSQTFSGKLLLSVV